jgi:hypothetical protein
MTDLSLPLPLVGGQASPPTRRCRKCGSLKPLDEFSKVEYGKRRTLCKDCAAARARAYLPGWNERNPDKKKVYSSTTYERTRLDVTQWIANNLRTTRAYCKNRKLPCDITAESMTELFAAQDGLCALTGRSLVYGSRGQQRDSISIDRIIPTDGYVLGNVRLVTYQANMARGQFHDDELFAFCEAVLARRAA